MRLIILGLTLVLAASQPLSAIAQAPVMTQPLGAGEVLLEVNALGYVTTRADRASLSINITGSGETEAAARTAAERNVAEIRTMLRAQGVADSDIRVQPVTAYADSMAAMESNAMTMDMTDTNMAEPAPSASANAQTEITLRNVDRLPAIQAALMERGIYAVAGASYALNDDTVPRRQARAQALQKARADAEAYAASLNMRVVRVVRVTERLGLDLLSLAGSEFQIVSQIFSPAMFRAGGGQVPTIVAVGVDFALAPR